MEELEKFIVTAKARGWVSTKPGGKRVSPSRKSSLDIIFEDGDYFYQDSFVGLTNFCGQEHICYKDDAVWSQIYYGYILRPDLIDGSEVVEVLRAALGALYLEGRFLGAFEYSHREFVYEDRNQGDYSRFSGQEEIHINGEVVYQLQYLGGLVSK